MMDVLILDDSRLYQQLLINVFGQLGYKARGVSTAAEARACLAETQADVICLNMYLQDSTGPEFAQWYREHFSSRNVPILMLTSAEDEYLRQEAMKAGVTEVFSKGDGGALSAAIQEYFTHEKTEHLAGSRVLYVEDSVSLARMTMAILTDLRLQVDHFTSAEAALAAFRQSPPDLVITDIILDGKISGLGLVKQIRSLPDETGQLPLLAMTGHDEANRRLELYRAGVNDYVTKPMVEEEFRARVINLLSSKKLLDQVRIQQAELRDLALKDKLTGCHNRHSMVEFGPSAIATALKQKQDLSLMMIDLDHFKLINDEFGHSVGDDVLAEVGLFLNRKLSGRNYIARFGGEEFLVLLPKCTADNAMSKAEQLRNGIQNLLPGGKRVTASIGVTHLQPPGDSCFDRLFERADQAVYAAKNDGRNRVCLR